jgi:hypothetical protein
MKRVAGVLCLSLLTAACGDPPLAPSPAETGGPAAEAPTVPVDSHTLSGQVLCDREQPILLANVSVFTAAGALVAMAFTDLEGHYTIAGVSGPVSVRVSAVGFEPQRTSADVTDDLSIDFTLKRIP